MKMKKEVFKITFTGIMLSLAVVLSAFLQIKLIGDIRLDLSYVVIVVMCYLYGGLVGGFFAGGVALLNSMFFTAYGVSISWISANLIIGVITGIVLNGLKDWKPKHIYIKHIINVSTIIFSCAIGLLLTKTIIECNLYHIPLLVKLTKNSIAFASDTFLMIFGYFTLIPIYRLYRNKLQ